jgi:hypothetical protein
LRIKILKKKLTEVAGIMRWTEEEKGRKRIKLKKKKKGG